MSVMIPDCMPSPKVNVGWVIVTVTVFPFPSIYVEVRRGGDVGVVEGGEMGVYIVGSAVGDPDVVELGGVVGVIPLDVRVDEEPGKGLVVTGPTFPLLETVVEELELMGLTVVITVDTMVVVIYVL